MNKTYAIILLTEGVFGGAEKRFTRIFFYLNAKRRGSVLYFVSSSLRQRIVELYPYDDHDFVIALNNNTNVQSPTDVLYAKPSKHSRLKSYLKNTFLYKALYFLETRKTQNEMYKVLKKYNLQYGIVSYISVFSGVLPLYFFLRTPQLRPGIIFSNMDSWFSSISQNPRKEWYRKYVSFNYAHEKSDFVDFLSPFIYEGVKKLGVKIDPEKVHFTPCSFADYSKCRIGDKKKIRITFSGRLERDKNPEMFIKAGTILAEEFDDIEFHIMGEGRLSQTVSDLVKSTGLSNIVYHGFHSNPPEILAESSLFVSIQTSNNYPSQSILEAMACGNAIIASDVGDTRMFVNELNGSLIPLELTALTNAIRDYINNPQMTLTKGLHAAEYVRKEFTIEKAGEYYLGLFEQAAQKMKSN
jgi:glycosyltransferase involved in cell wall biosynthesis